MAIQDNHVGIRELKTHLSRYLQRVKAGQTLLITERGQVVGRIVPAEQSLEERLDAMRAAGLLAWSGKRLQALEPIAQIEGNRTVAGLLIEDRE